MPTGWPTRPWTGCVRRMTADGALAARSNAPPTHRQRGRHAAVDWTGNRGRPTRLLLLLRHGQTELFRQRRYSWAEETPNHRDRASPAADAARYLAGKGGDHLGNRLLAAAPRLRHRQGSGRRSGLAVRVDEDLTETDFGEWED